MTNICWSSWRYSDDCNIIRQPCLELQPPPRIALWKLQLASALQASYSRACHPYWVPTSDYGRWPIRSTFHAEALLRLLYCHDFHLFLMAHLFQSSLLMIWSDIDLEIPFNDLMANVHAESKNGVSPSRLLILWLKIRNISTYIQISLYDIF